MKFLPSDMPIPFQISNPESHGEHPKNVPLILFPYPPPLTDDFTLLPLPLPLP